MTCTYIPSTRTIAKCGVTLIHQPIFTTAVVAVDVWVSAGAACEPAERAGVAHFLEHMIFKGTDQILPGEFDALIEDFGGSSNAATSHDYAHFGFTTASDQFALPLKCLAELLLAANIPDQEFERERGVVIEEMFQALDDPDWIAYHNLMATAYGDHPYGRPVLGYESSLRNLTAADLRQYHQGFYRPELMTVVVVGNVELEEAITRVEEAFSGKYRSNQAAACEFTPVPLSQIPAVQVRQLYGVEQARLTMAWLGCNISELAEVVELEMLAMILAGGRCSRLVRSLREQKGWVLDIGSDFTAQRSPGLFTVSALLDAHFLEPVEHQIQQEIELLNQTLISCQEIAHARKAMTNQFAFMTESPQALASVLGYYAALGCDLAENWFEHYCDLLAGATPQRLQALTQKYLPSDRYTITCLLPI
ncbi:MAG: pitrilysin family protein [Pseudanabaenaceae cyanobacterium bins.68]|nr:pitrilysin family protein [Pseudanabaenaceae cyanobacterium bins.68]